MLGALYCGQLIPAVPVALVAAPVAGQWGGGFVPGSQYPGQAIPPGGREWVAPPVQWGGGFVPGCQYPAQAVPPGLGEYTSPEPPTAARRAAGGGGAYEARTPARKRQQGQVMAVVLAFLASRN